MGSDFYPGMVVGLILGVFITMVGITVMARYATPKNKEKEEDHDSANWWKRGNSPYIDE